MPTSYVLFSKSLKTRLGDYHTVTKRDLARMRGNFAQSVLLANKRSGYLHIIPTFYVVGADPAEEVMTQTMSLPMSGMDSSRMWSFAPDVPLDDRLADKVVEQLENSSPLSFCTPLSDDAIHNTLTKFATSKQHWAPSLALAFWEILTGAASAPDSLKNAKEQFIRFSRYGMRLEPLDYERALMARYEELRERLDSPAGLRQCRAEAEAHALRLKLPPVIWPPEWPV